MDNSLQAGIDLLLVNVIRLRKKLTVFHYHRSGRGHDKGQGHECDYTFCK